MRRRTEGNSGLAVGDWLILGAVIWFILICVSSGARSSTSTSRQVVATDRPAQAESSSVRFVSTPTKIPARLQACVDNETIRIRKGPGTQYETIGGLVSGTCMSVLGRNQDASWFYMVGDGKKEGWVAAWFLTVDGDVYDVPVKDVLPTYTTEVVMPKGNHNSGNASGSGSGGNSAGGIHPGEVCPVEEFQLEVVRGLLPFVQMVLIVIRLIGREHVRIMGASLSGWSNGRLVVPRLF